MKVLLVIGLALLTGCTLLSAKDLDLSLEARLFQAQGEFNILLEAANSYAQRPHCSATLVIGCSDAQVIDEALRIAERIKAALEIAQTAETPTLGLVTTLTIELNMLLVKALVTETGVPS